MPCELVGVEQREVISLHHAPSMRVEFGRLGHVGVAGIGSGIDGRAPHGLVGGHGCACMVYGVGSMVFIYAFGCVRQSLEIL